MPQSARTVDTRLSRTTTNLAVLVGTEFHEPDFLTGFERASIFEHSRRVISWSTMKPGEILRNSFQAAWVEVWEMEQWKGEPLWLGASRRTSNSSYVRSGFTDRARKTLHEVIVPAVARHGFGRLWEQGFDPVKGYSDRQLDEAEKYLLWCQQRRELEELFREGMIELRPVSRQANGRTHQQVSVYHGIRTNGSLQSVSAEARLDGEQIGWLTDRGVLVPLDGA